MDGRRFLERVYRLIKVLNFRSRLIRLLGSAVVLCVVAGCATPPPADDPQSVAEFEAERDPFQPTNRAIFGFNQFVDSIIIKPVAKGYRWLLPNPARDGIHNFLANLREPLTFLNDVMQGEVTRAGITFGRFGINSTIGVLGLFDVAKAVGLEPHKEDFGQTLAVWGVGEGPYLMLPIIGPSNPRDLTGLVVDFFTDPFNIWANATNHDWAIPARTVLTAIDQRERLLDGLDELERDSLDYYIGIRSMNRQLRDAAIKNTDLPDDEVPNLMSDSGDLPEDSGVADTTETTPDNVN